MSHYYFYELEFIPKQQELTLLENQLLYSYLYYDDEEIKLIENPSTSIRLIHELANSCDWAQHRISLLHICKTVWNDDIESTSQFYSYEEDLKALSFMFPYIVFKLTRENTEVFGDGDVYYFKNGKTQHCPAKITFDESKLK